MNYRYDLDEPCLRCQHNQGTDRDEPCCRCKWNIGATPDGDHFKIIPGDKHEANVSDYLKAIDMGVI